jgi:hypothetical protein
MKKKLHYDTEQVLMWMESEGTTDELRAKISELVDMIGRASRREALRQSQIAAASQPTPKEDGETEEVAAPAPEPRVLH